MKKEFHQHHPMCHRNPHFGYISSVACVIKWASGMRLRVCVCVCAFRSSRRAEGEAEEDVVLLLTDTMIAEAETTAMT